MKRSAEVRAAQTRRNVEAGLKFHGLFYGLVLFGTLTDRTIYYLKLPAHEFIHRMEYLEKNGLFKKWGANGNHGTTASFGWRECVTQGSMQIVLHQYNVDGTRTMLEVDYDMWNPDVSRGLFSSIAHGVECMWPGKTDPFKIAKLLNDRGVWVNTLNKGVIT